MTDHADTPPTPDLTAVLVLADGSIFWGHGFGAEGAAVGEVCFNTAMTGYQEVLSDPSYAGQIITFTFPHIGNVGTNHSDNESKTPAARGLVVRNSLTDPSNYRSDSHLDAWLKAQNLIGISGIDTRRLTRQIRLNGAPNGVIAHNAAGQFDIPALRAQAQAWPGLEGMDLAIEVGCTQPYEWDQAGWQFADNNRANDGYDSLGTPRVHVVAIDYGVKRNILRCLASAGARVTVVPPTATAAEILAHKPDGVMLSNGPGDPAATGVYAVPVIRELLDRNIPILGICLGHQMLALALGGRTLKMHQGHRGANHPVKDLTTGKVEITCMNHGFTVEASSLPANVKVSHISLFDQTVCGLQIEGKPVISVQHHPEVSPGPQDSHYLFERFLGLIEAHA
ncbi:glutamine-hydrolyzing carbamoyl-phosphate synthase small subunit [Govanella unica]|uniref:Carbamoyl phosphate synthase small chain n=1 Tax=Govanella unica TaxID=2975056 RepID=A0A9X3U0N9_9PROT|nr:glutamine-hydrolyzing carbamoyl-phosphate synthase small subunit [Govania unica]MDA5194978.1 glutamine-hydrolyzing carbamoyl-phosphate synthase small subunit [Govania unica]